ncbi:hypothetical protein [Natronococcus occultus]|uniref:Uncharacterized protein n=1 Tax=Natronococcus occultus SP4 TaxID=694430 RepID=L0K4P7_9EURY|nr:hypothetical protein [Natronococcus occultus]AGB39088.1 hypothetical protein Natoc_3356 [Natronococcus occultus SP4]
MPPADRPTPPDELDPELRAVLEALADCDPGTIRTVADHADALATWAESRSTENDGRPDGVPEEATVSTLEVDGETYRHYQWREGDAIRSKTVRP